jgi:DNA polymerase-3 subunit epsilon
MIIAGSDTETTGLAPGDHRFVEVYVGLWDTESRSKFDEFSARIDPQRNIPADASRIHGIFAADLAGQPHWEAVAPPFRRMLEKADVHVGHNWDGFDLPFINYELKRVGMPALTKPTMDTMLIGRGATAMGTVPTLGALCWAFDVPYDPEKAHGAAYDVEVMMACVFKGLDWGRFQLPVAEKAMAA